MKIKNFKETYKMLLIYCISTVIAMCLIPLFVKYEFSEEHMKNYIVPLVLFTIIYIILVKLFNVKSRSVILFLILISVLISIVIINVDIEIFLSLGSTPEEGGVPILTFIALYTTLPFQMIIYILIGYKLTKYIWIVMSIYLIILGLFSCKFKKINICNFSNKKKD